MAKKTMWLMLLQLDKRDLASRLKKGHDQWLESNLDYLTVSGMRLL